ncbi:MAG: S8 family serine peptidase, partial [bacterium]|nr:S8 family serine peptidase [bacterium]
MNGSLPIPGGFDEGDPDHARLVITRRAAGGTAQWIEDNPDTPLARLERYIVLGYPEPVNLETVELVLDENPNVENVERNIWLTLSVAGAPPDDPPLPRDPLIDPALGDPELYQWGSHALNLPAAWQYAKGHAWVGLIDIGLEIAHPDLRTYSRDVDDNLVFDGGNFREHLSEDVRFGNCSVDEMDPEDGINREHAGHGTHVAGIVAATTDNADPDTGEGIGVAGACWNCSILMMRAGTDDDPGRFDDDYVQMYMDRVVDSLDTLVSRGVQVVSMSLGVEAVGCEDVELDLRAFCQTLGLAEERDVVLVASAGNDKTVIDFPANDPRVMSIGGIEFDEDSSTGYTFWDEAPDCPFSSPPFPPNFECGSNFGPEQDLVAPAKAVVSTVYTGLNHANFASCGDSYHPMEGYGTCTGTSMSSPYIAGIAGILRSVNPWLSKQEIRDLMITTSSQATARNDQLGYGVPDTAAAVERALGKVAGRQLTNRLTPLFSLYSPQAQTHVYTVFPSAASAFVFDLDEPFETVGPEVVGYEGFPGVPGCPISPCLIRPSASVYLFTTNRNPDPEGPALVPLYRLRYDPNIPNRCVDPDSQRISNRDFSYTTEELGVIRFKEDIVDQDGVGYELDGIEGYIFPRCDPEPECIPEGTERLYRLYHPVLDDYAIFPQSELDSMILQGYESQPGLNDWVGYVYTNIDVDGDGDGLVDGFEALIGTDPASYDTDCDGMSDGDEILFYDM